MSQIEYPTIDDTRPYEPTHMTTALWQLITPEPIDPNKLILAQNGVTILGLLHAKQNHTSYCGDVYPHVVEFDNGLYLSDGHHRVALALLNNAPYIHVRILWEKLQLKAHHE